MPLPLIAGAKALRLSRPVLISIGIAALLALAGVGAWRAAASLRAAIGDARAAGKAEADALWRAEIAKSEAAVANARADQARVAAEADARASRDQMALTAALAELEKSNAALPRGDACGLDRDRVRLLPR